MITSHASENLDSVNVFIYLFILFFSFLFIFSGQVFSSNDRLNVYIINYGLKGASLRLGPSSHIMMLVVFLYISHVS